MISPEVMQELLSVRQVLHYLPEVTSSDKGWTEHEQHLFWVALTQHPQGPWTTIAEFIGTKSARQAMTHGQKLRQKLKRWNERLRSNPTASMLLDGVNVSTRVDRSATDISVGAAPMDESFQSTVSLAVQVGVLNAGLIVDGVSIVEMADLPLSDANTIGPNCQNMSGSAPAVEMGLSSQFPVNSTSFPHTSEDTTRVVELMLSETSAEVVVADFSDDPAILHQDLLDDLLDILSDDDLNELNHHHHHSSNMP